MIVLRGAGLSWIEILGLVAGALVTIGFLPQIIRILRLKSAYEISLPFTLLLLSGVSCWLIYGLLLQLISVVLWNGTMAALALVLIYAKLRYGMGIKRKHPPKL